MKNARRFWAGSRASGRWPRTRSWASCCGDVYDRLDLMALCSAMPDGEARRQNLMLLLEYAKKYEATGYRGLHRFLGWLQRLADRGEEPDSGAAAGDCVRIMSVHKSKGLEFPVVFLCDAGRRFNMQDTRGTVLVHPKLGLGPKVTDTERNIEYPQSRPPGHKAPDRPGDPFGGAAAFVRGRHPGKGAAFYNRRDERP
jgi:ATP-dependent exoDNAse (exonuclease V) beta subunit